MGDSLDIKTRPGRPIEVAKEPLEISRVMKVPSSSIGSWELLKTYWDRRKSSGEMMNKQVLAKKLNTYNYREVSTACIMKIARAKLLLQASLNSDNLYAPDNVLINYPGLSAEAMEDVELALLLQASAENVAHREFDCARILLNMCDCCSPETGNPVQRVVFYFAEALKEKIERDTGLLSIGFASENQLDTEKILHAHIQTLISLQNDLPFSPITRFTGMQAILDNVASAKKIHLIDLGIQSGCHWTILLQALAERNDCAVELLTITSVGTNRSRLEWAGRQLMSFARDKVPFKVAFKVVVSKIAELRENLFEVESGEKVVVYSNMQLCSLLASQSHLESFLSLIKIINPCLMVVIEQEVKTSHSTFLDRFNNYLIHTSAVFDCIHSCVAHMSQTREVSEGILLGDIIKNIVVTEGEERRYHHESIDFWEAQFARFGLVQAEFSSLSLYQASLILKRSPKWMPCTLETKGKCLIINWKGVPVQSFSVWKFQDVNQVE
ncbi:hypothetical protein LIER_21432 [Lithospermum erythrorhizon]|uniref:DELLA protein RGL1 n=1 Tax=Lithospermum erythrorhizon TaxID=34254 RepID=A0AAV3QQB9_LITER